jgi:hypothetical protein
MSNLNGNDNKFFFLKATNDTIVTDTISRVIFFASTHRQRFTFRIWAFKDTIKKLKNSFLYRVFQLCKLTVSNGVKYKRPRFFRQLNCFRNGFSFLQKKIPFYLNVDILHKKPLHLRNLLLLPKAVLRLFLHKNFWSDGFFEKERLNVSLMNQATERLAFLTPLLNIKLIKYNTYYKKRISVCGFVLLAACSSASESFDSEATQGVGAKSISEVNQMIDEGKLQGVQGDNAEKPEAPRVVSKSAERDSETITLSDNSLVQRQPEEHLRVWIAPYQDLSGNFHEASLVHTLKRPSYWQVVG